MKLREMLQLRAAMLRQARQFLDDRGYLEVDTPLLSADVCVDAFLDPIVVSTSQGERYLQTSPEFCMKRLLAAGVGSCYQICHAFRADECGPMHNPEFTLVEWYRVGGTYPDLMAETAAFVSGLLNLTAKPVHTTYREVFTRCTGIDPLTAADNQLVAYSREHGFVDTSASRDDHLTFLFDACVQPTLTGNAVTVVADFPPGQSALAQLRHNADGSTVAERFEVFADGVELANGYHELLDSSEWRQRAERQNAIRHRKGKTTLPIESRLLQAMEAGLPASAGVAVGFDRLVMLRAKADSLATVVPFLWDQA